MFEFNPCECEYIQLERVDGKGSKLILLTRCDHCSQYHEEQT